MKTYRVHFSFYNERDGRFDDSAYRVDAENQFEARRAAWLMRDTDDETRFQSCARQCGVTWDASPLNLEDYLNEQASEIKCQMRIIKNVALQNAEIEQSADKTQEAKSELSYLYGSLDTISITARDVGKPFGMEPPTIREEIEYAWQLVGKLSEAGQHDQAQALAERTEAARKWDNTAIYTLRELFSDGYIHLRGESVSFRDHFGRDGVFPEKSDLSESEYTFARRWRNARHIETLRALPIFGERDIIKNSQLMPVDYNILALRMDAVKPDFRSPENSLWMPEDLSGDQTITLGGDPDHRFNARNLITGMVVDLKCSDFAGVLRPEFSENIDFDALRQEYAQTRAAEQDNNWEMEE
ncbi:MAG: hypothetical protein LBK41_00495 [Clostridiales bacterium]|nr:hypothetical protein [Clostridiales bacterium]